MREQHTSIQLGGMEIAANTTPIANLKVSKEAPVIATLPVAGERINIENDFMGAGLLPLQ